MFVLFFFDTKKILGLCQKDNEFQEKNNNRVAVAVWIINFLLFFLCQE